MVEKGIANELVRAGAASLHSRAPSTAAAKIDAYLRAHAPPSASRDRVDDAIQAALLAVVRGRFAGGTDEQAVAWLNRVLHNELAKQLRHAFDGAEPDAPATEDSDASAVDGRTELRELVRSAARLLLDVARTVARRRDLRSVEVDFDLWLSASLGESMASQIGRAGALLRRTRQNVGISGIFGEARGVSARIRQRRHRGRLAALRALERLRAADSWPAELDPALPVMGLSPVVR